MCVTRVLVCPVAGRTSLVRMARQTDNKTTEIAPRLVRTMADQTRHVRDTCPPLSSCSRPNATRPHGHGTDAAPPHDGRPDPTTSVCWRTTMSHAQCVRTATVKNSAPIGDRAPHAQPVVVVRMGAIASSGLGKFQAFGSFHGPERKKQSKIDTHTDRRTCRRPGPYGKAVAVCVYLAQTRSKAQQLTHFLIIQESAMWYRTSSDVTDDNGIRWMVL